MRFSAWSGTRVPDQVTQTTLHDHLTAVWLGLWTPSLLQPLSSLCGGCCH